MSLELPRRRFLASLVGLVAAPAVVKASSLMKVSRFRETAEFSNLVLVDGLPVRGNLWLISWGSDKVEEYPQYSISTDVWREFNEGFSLRPAPLRLLEAT